MARFLLTYGPLRSWYMSRAYFDYGNFFDLWPVARRENIFFFVIVCQPTKNVNPCLKSRAGAIGQSGWGVGVRVEVEGGWAVGR